MVRGLDIWSQSVGAHGGGRRNEDPTSTNKTVGRWSESDWNEGKDMVRQMTPANAQPLHQRALVVGGRRQFQRAQQRRLGLIGRCSEQPHGSSSRRDLNNAGGRPVLPHLAL